MEPAPERRLPPERREALPDPDEHVLGHLVGQDGVAGHPAAQGEDAPDVVSVDLREGIDVPLLRTLYGQRDRVEVDGVRQWHLGC
jgi:hypothetical protein